ncbi:hypothetical protein HDU86_003241 [Geranomyces michiganensis]|nr:hypothetical protein HDU86_003241 [Geranomyces michiganensis]
MGGPRYSMDHAALRRAVVEARKLPYDETGKDWTIEARDGSSAVVTDSNGFIRASFSSAHRFTPQLLLDLLLQACHTRVSRIQSPYLSPARPHTISFLASTNVPSGAIGAFASLVETLEMGIVVAPIWDEDRRKSETLERLDKGAWWGSAEAQAEREWAAWQKQEEERKQEWWYFFWTILLLLPLVNLIAKRWKAIQDSQEQQRKQSIRPSQSIAAAALQ